MGLFSVKTVRPTPNALRRPRSPQIRSSFWRIIARDSGILSQAPPGRPDRPDAGFCDTVNFASRLEALNKDFNSQFLISEAVRDALGEACGDAVSLGEVAVRGYERPMAVWRLG